MTLEEARKVAEAIAIAHGGCSYCVSDIAERLTQSFPEFEWRLDVNRHSKPWEVPVEVIERVME